MITARTGDRLALATALDSIIDFLKSKSMHIFMFNRLSELRIDFSTKLGNSPKYSHFFPVVWQAVAITLSNILCCKRLTFEVYYWGQD